MLRRGAAPVDAALPMFSPIPLEKVKFYLNPVVIFWWM